MCYRLVRPHTRSHTYTPWTFPQQSTSAAGNTDSGSWWSCWWCSFCLGGTCTPCSSARCGERSPAQETGDPGFIQSKIVSYVIEYIERMFRKVSNLEVIASATEDVHYIFHSRLKLWPDGCTSNDALYVNMPYLGFIKTFKCVCTR